MADNVKWIQMKLGMFDGNSFKRIKRATIGGIEYRDKLTAVWFELMDLAGKSNRNGFLVDGNGIPFQCDDYEDIACMIDRKAEEVKLCIGFFIGEKMVEIIDDMYCLPNFVKYQALEGLEKIREQKRLAQAKWRDRTRQGLIGQSENEESVDEKTSTPPSTDGLPSISLKSISLITDSEIKDMFTTLYKTYPVHKDQAQALKTFGHKVSGLTLAEAKEKGNKIFLLMKQRMDDDWATCDPKYIPHFSSWLNKEVPDQRKASGATHKRGKK